MILEAVASFFILFAVLFQVFFLPTLHAVFIYILVKCYREDKKHDYYIAIPTMEILTLIGLSEPITVLSGIVRGGISQEEAPFSLVILLYLSFWSPHVLVTVDAILCLHRLFSFFQIAPWFREYFKWFMFLSIILSIPTSYTLAFQRNQPLSNGNEMTLSTSYIISAAIKTFLVVFTLSGYILILWSVNREKSAMTTSAAKKESHKTIVLQALPIAMCSFIYFISDVLTKLQVDIGTSVRFAPNFDALRHYTSGYVVPFSIIIGNPKKRKIFTSFSFKSNSIWSKRTTKTSDFVNS